jgi:Fur family ferric uptake transcriptional regulator
MKRRGQRVTPQRAVILETVAHLDRHVTVQEVYDQARQRLPGLHLATVYRALEGLQQAGLVDPFVAGPGVTAYALRHEDHPHGHLVCQRCGCTMDFDPQLAAELAARIEAGHRFQIDLNHPTLRGLCPECRQAEPAGHQGE